MDQMFSMFMLSTVLLAHNSLTYATPIQSTVEIVTGHSKAFTGETVRLKCIPPATPYESVWSYNWYNGDKQFQHVGEQLVLWNIKTKDNGKYCCQSIRDTNVQDIRSSKSVPIEIRVDGGWAILDGPSQGVVGFPMNMTCRVRHKQPIHEVILYRNGVEVLKQDNPNIILDNFTVADGGEYACRASWNRNGRTRSVISTQMSVQVLEPLTEPILTIVDNEKLRSLSKIKLECKLQYNVPAPAPPVLYYFYINDKRHGTPTLDNYYLVGRIRGTFKCNAKVFQFGLSQWSEPKSFEPV